MHYINENEDVLVSLEKEIPQGWYGIPYFSNYYAGQITINNSLFVVSKMYSLAYKEFNEPTLAMTHKKWMDANGYLFDDDYWFKGTLLSKYRNYDTLNLACLYGGNYRNFEILKPFIVPADYIQAKYDGDKITEFIEKLKADGFIKIN